MRGDLKPLSNTSQTKITSHEQEDETEVFESLEPIYTVFDSNYLLQQPMAETTKTEDRAQARSTAIARKMRQREEDAEPTGLPSKRRRSVRGSPLHPGSIAGEDGGDGEADAMDAGASQASTDTSLLNEHTYSIRPCLSPTIRAIDLFRKEAREQVRDGHCQQE